MLIYDKNVILLLQFLYERIYYFIFMKSAAEIKKIAKECDNLFVIGSRNSSNSVRLVEVAKNNGCENAELIHSESSFPLDKISKCKTIGISSGASAPEVLVKEFIENMAKFGADINSSLSQPAPLYIKPPDAHTRTQKISMIK